MSAANVHGEQAELARENEALRRRVAALEDELVELQERTNAAVAEWQERAYWLDRLHIDLNKVMERPGADQARLALRSVRLAYWKIKRLKRRLLRS